MNIEAKLDKIMDKLDRINGRWEDIEKKFEYYEAKFVNMEQKFSKIEESLNNKADLTDLQNPREKLDAIFESILTENLMKEFYSKIYGLEGPAENAWETKEQTKENNFDKFMNEGLQEDPNALSLVDIH